MSALHPTRGAPVRVVLVESDRALRIRWRRQLGAAGYLVHTAPEARSGFRTVAITHPDLVISDDISLLTAVRSDAMLASTPVITSATIDPRANGSVARDSSAAALVLAMTDALARRFGILALLPAGAVWGPLSDVSFAALCDAACDQRLRAVLSVDDGVANAQVWFDDGVIVAARSLPSVAPKISRVDVEALLTLLALTDAPFTFELTTETPPRTIGVSWAQLRGRLGAEIALRRARVPARTASAAPSASAAPI